MLKNKNNTPVNIALNDNQKDIFFMQQAIIEAKIAQAQGDVPVGAVIVLNNKIIAKGHNHKELNQNPMGHAEIMALLLASQTLQTWRLLETTLYCTLEPCAMCASAMVHARIKKLVFATHDLKTGAAGSVFNLVNNPKLNHQIEIQEGILKNECQHLLSLFFKNKRANNKR